jgi:hypothetical protein
MAPENAADLRARPAWLADGSTVRHGGFSDIDAFPATTLAPYTHIVTNRSPLGSRPPGDFALARAGQFYNVWQRTTGSGRTLSHLSLGSDLQPVAVPACSDVQSLARAATAAGGWLAAVERAPAVVAARLNLGSYPAGWLPADPATRYPPDGIYPLSPGVLRMLVDVQASARYDVWIGGVFPGTITLRIDGVVAGSATHRLLHPGQHFLLGSLPVSTGTRSIEIDYSTPVATPGSHATFLGPMGPVVLATSTDAASIERIESRDWRTLCGRALDWIEAVAPR